MTTNNETTPIMKKNQKAAVDGYKERKKGAAAAPLTTTLMMKIGLVVTIVSALMFFFFTTGTAGTTSVEVTNLLRSSTGTGDGILVTAAADDVTKGETEECPYQCQGADADSGKCCTSTMITCGDNNPDCLVPWGDSQCFDCFLVTPSPGPTTECRDSPNAKCQEEGRKCCTSAGITNGICSFNGPSDTCQCENTFPKFRNTPCYIDMRCPIGQMWQHHDGWLSRDGCKLEPGATCKLGGINQCSTGNHCALRDTNGKGDIGFICTPK